MRPCVDNWVSRSVGIVGERPFVAILDSSAIVDFTTDSIALGELLFEAGDDGGVVGLPALCMAQAVPRCKDRDLLDLLSVHRTSGLIQPSADWRATAALHDFVGHFDLTSAMLDAIDYDNFVITRNPTAYGELVNNHRVVAY